MEATGWIAGFAVNQIRNWHFSQPISEDQEVLDKYSVNPPNVYGFGHKAYYQHIVDCLESGAPALVDGKEGRDSLELVVALYESIATSREVVLPLSSQLQTRLGETR